MWAQWDWGAGPVIAGRRTNLFCASGVARVVIATWDRTLPTVIACVDRAIFGGAPTYWLTDNERITIDHGWDRRPIVAVRLGGDVCAGGPGVRPGDGASRQGGVDGSGSGPTMNARVPPAPAHRL